MYYANVTEELEIKYEYLGISKNSEILEQLTADLEIISKMIEMSKGRAKWKLEGVAEALKYTIDLLK